MTSDIQKHVTAFVYALISSRNLDAIKAYGNTLREQGGDINLSGYYVDGIAVPPVLHLALSDYRKSDVFRADIVRYLIECGADIYASQEGKTPLLHALEKRHTCDVVQAIVEGARDTGIKKILGITGNANKAITAKTIFLAACEGRDDVLDYLVACYQKEKVTLEEIIHTEDALEFFQKNVTPKAIKTLIKIDPECVTRKDKNNKTVLMHCSMASKLNEDVILTLINHGANLFEGTDRRSMPIDKLISRIDDNYANANIDISFSKIIEKKHTAYLLSQSNGNERLIFNFLYLLGKPFFSDHDIARIQINTEAIKAQGIDINLHRHDEHGVKNETIPSVLHYVLSSSSKAGGQRNRALKQSVIHYLVAQGADLNIIYNKTTPFIEAVKHNFSASFIDTLIKKGAQVHFSVHSDEFKQIGFSNLPLRLACFKDDGILFCLITHYQKNNIPFKDIVYYEAPGFDSIYRILEDRKSISALFRIEPDILTKEDAQGRTQFMRYCADPFIDEDHIAAFIRRGACLLQPSSAGVRPLDILLKNPRHHDFSPVFKAMLEKTALKNRENSDDLDDLNNEDLPSLTPGGLGL